MQTVDDLVIFFAAELQTVWEELPLRIGGRVAASKSTPWLKIAWAMVRAKVFF